MQLCPVKYSGVLGRDRVWKYDGAPTTAMRIAGPIGTELIPLETISPGRTPAAMEPRRRRASLVPFDHLVGSEKGLDGEH